MRPGNRQLSGARPAPTTPKPAWEPPGQGPAPAVNIIIEADPDAMRRAFTGRAGQEFMEAMRQPRQRAVMTEDHRFMRGTPETIHSGPRARRRMQLHGAWWGGYTCGVVTGAFLTLLALLAGRLL